eukprot:TRINITY_DN2379_c1_g1_i3.p4 TRINITY_DN2379_c1_g1~~TRINITY_DN2379_c1_g1_i3.p4  ORF type:complete len:217 (-),score=-10.93 TRINITY_DN2379_c1_g1_i3:286-936(-)
MLIIVLHLVFVFKNNLQEFSKQIFISCVNFFLIYCNWQLIRLRSLAIVRFLHLYLCSLLDFLHIWLCARVLFIKKPCRVVGVRKFFSKIGTLQYDRKTLQDLCSITVWRFLKILFKFNKNYMLHIIYFTYAISALGEQLFWHGFCSSYFSFYFHMKINYPLKMNPLIFPVAIISLCVFIIFLFQYVCCCCNYLIVDDLGFRHTQVLILRFQHTQFI